MKKSRLVDKTKRLSPSMDTPQGRPPKERNGPRNTNIPRTGRESQARRANFPPAASQGRGVPRPGGARP